MVMALAHNLEESLAWIAKLKQRLVELNKDPEHNQSAIKATQMSLKAYGNLAKQFIDAETENQEDK